jgi:hypothetical protein
LGAIAIPGVKKLLYRCGVLWCGVLDMDVALDQFYRGTGVELHFNAVLATQVEMGFATNVLPGRSARVELAKVLLLLQNPAHLFSDAAIDGFERGIVGGCDDHLLIGMNRNVECFAGG